MIARRMGKSGKVKSSETTILDTGDDRHSHLLPAFVIVAEDAQNVPADRPAWLHMIQHGAAGANPWRAAGCMLPLAANQAEGTADLWLLTRALFELGPNWDEERSFDFPLTLDLSSEIARLTENTDSATPMGPSQIGLLNALLIRHIGVHGLIPPAADWGYEGLIRFRYETPWLFFGGWRTVCRCVVDGADWYRWDKYGRELERELHGLLGTPSRLSIFLLW